MNRHCPDCKREYAIGHQYDNCPHEVVPPTMAEREILSALRCCCADHADIRYLIEWVMTNVSGDGVEFGIAPAPVEHLLAEHLMLKVRYERALRLLHGLRALSRGGPGTVDDAGLVFERVDEFLRKRGLGYDATAPDSRAAAEHAGRDGGAGVDVQPVGGDVPDAATDVPA